ncbi:NTP transferase domain-containing protein [Hyphomonas sp.]|uniref:nucleotidyltransferase family protein n=1 Tax=Hyphomonas sp. TaxID=87 RepID=UPI0035671437
MFDRTAILLLASGLSSRFGTGDKLMADLDGRPVLARAAGALANRPVAKRVAVVGTDQGARAACLEALGFEIVLNPAPEDGQGRTLAIGSRYVRDATEADSVLILLGDMPFVTDTHLEGLAQALSQGASAAMSETGGRLSPPAVFRCDHFDQLAAVTGDRGARRIFETIPARQVVAAAPDLLMDIDCGLDLQRAEELLNG